MNESFQRNRAIGEPLLNIPALKKVVMVGAVVDRDGQLSTLDASLLRYGLEPLRETGLPVVVDSDLDVEIINKADIYGGRDFLTEEGLQADIVILCNIPHKMDQPEYTSSMTTLRGSFVMGVEDLAKHELSDSHWEPGIWARKIKETGAKIVVSYGVDSMPLEDVTPEGYFHAQHVKRRESSPQYVMDSKFVSDLPFSQWVGSHAELNRFVIDSQFEDMPQDFFETYDGPGRK